MSDSTGSIYKTFRDRLLTYSDGATPTLQARTGGRLYQEAPPADAVFPYGVLRILNVRSQQYGERLTGDLELFWYDRPANQLPRVRELADLSQKALHDFVNGAVATGLVRVTAHQRDAIPPGTGEVDAEVRAIRLVFSFFAWPKYLTSAP